MTNCQVFESAADTGVANMSADEILLLRAADQGLTSLRFYHWVRPTLSIGYFQSIEDRMSHPASANCEIVRRASGGGAILHDQEVTYSLAIRLDRSNRTAASRFYDLAHQSLIDALMNWNIRARMAERTDVQKHGGTAFLCFQRRSLGDVVLDDAKIAGSAQRRYKSALLQHGSLLLVRSESAPELPGVCDLVGRPLSTSELISSWRREFERRTGWNLESAEFSSTDRKAIDDITLQKFGCVNWTRRR